MILLGVNADHEPPFGRSVTGTNRIRTGALSPDPAAMARLAEEAGADGITMHVREDRRHVRVEDTNVPRTQEDEAQPRSLPSPEMVELALSLKPESVCLVPENCKEVTTEGGLDARATSNVHARWSAHSWRPVFRPACSSIRIPLNPRPGRDRILGRVAYR